LGCANFLNSVPFKIKDLEFFPNSIYKFVTCGIKHMAVWSYIGTTLTYYSLEIENPKVINSTEVYKTIKKTNRI